MSAVPGILHDPRTGSARRVALAREGGVLRLTGEGVDKSVSLSGVRVAAGGWAGDAAHLVWNDGGSEWAVTVSGHEAVGALAGLLPPSLAADADRLRARGVRSARRGRRTLSLLGALLLAPLLLLGAAWAFRERLVDAAVRRLPVSVDAQIGEIARKQVEVSHRLLDAGPAADAVRAIGQRLVAAAGPPAAGFRFRFEVAADPSLNAFAAPGGLVVVHTGLIAAARTPDEVSGVLAHEIAHVLERHSMRQIVLQSGVAASVQLLVGSPDGAAGALAAAAADLATLRFSRDQEHAADIGGLDLLRKAELPPDGLLGFFDRLAREGGGPPAFLSTHPAPDDRVSRLQAEIARRAAWPARPLDLDWNNVQAALAKP